MKKAIDQSIWRNGPWTLQNPGMEHKDFHFIKVVRRP